MWERIFNKSALQKASNSLLRQQGMTNRLFSKNTKQSTHDRFFLLTNAISDVRPKDHRLFDSHLEKRQKAKNHLQAAAELLSEAEHDLWLIDVPPVFKMSMLKELRDIRQAIKEIESPTTDEHNPNPPRL